MNHSGNNISFPVTGWVSAFAISLSWHGQEYEQVTIQVAPTEDLKPQGGPPLPFWQLQLEVL